jgi:hypothetical protein
MTSSPSSSSSAGSWLPVSTGVAALALAGSFVLCAAVPLAAYTFSLSMFGLAHALTEFRFVDERFSGRLPGWFKWGLAGLLAAAALGRIARIWDWWPTWQVIPFEIVIVLALIALTLPVVVKLGRENMIAAGVLGVALVAGLAISPGHAILFLAIAHNFTPTGFLWEALAHDREQRADAMLWCAAAFIALPLLLASGLPAAWLGSLGLTAPNWDLLPTGGQLAAQFGAFLPKEWHSAGWAGPVFSAIVFTQWMHYLTVIHVLPRLSGDRPPAMPWPKRPVFIGAVVLLGTLLFGYFTQDFAKARALYGVVAVVHAYVELPLLLMFVRLPRAS